MRHKPTEQGMMSQQNKEHSKWRSQKKNFDVCLYFCELRKKCLLYTLFPKNWVLEPLLDTEIRIF